MVPFEGFRSVARCRRVVTAPPATSRGVSHASECCKRQCSGLFGLPAPALASSLPIACAVFLLSPSAEHFRIRLILPCAWPLLQSLSSNRRPGHACPSSFRGLPSLIAASSSGVHRHGHPRPTPFRPRRFARPRRLSPLPDLRVCFAPLPRPGFPLQGFCQVRSCTGSSPAVALVSLRVAAPAFRALLRLPVRFEARWFRPHPSRSPLELHPPSGFPSHTVRATFVTPPTTAFFGPRRVARPRPDLLLRACLPRSRFLAFD